jgi:pimeloyl-ACP methyl ester carboxylesterase
MRAASRALGLALLALALLLAACSVQAARRETADPRDVAPATGRYVHAHDLDVYVQETGPATGPPVLFVHGFGAWSETLREAIAPLAAAGFRCIAVDLPPFGFSQRPTTPAYARRDHALRLLGVLDALRIQKAALVGHSYGGGATMETLLTAQDRFSAVALIDVAIDIAPGGQRELSPAWPVEVFFAARPLRNAVLAATATNPALSATLLRRMVARQEAVTPQRVRIYQAPLALRGSTDALGDWLRHDMLASHAGSLAGDARSYARVTVPSLVVWGREDTLTPLAQGERLVSLIPGARLVVLDGVGHIPQIEDPPQVSRALLAFLTGPAATHNPGT